MPRDLVEAAKEAAMNNMPQLTKSPEAAEELLNDPRLTRSNAQDALSDSDDFEDEQDDGPLGAVLAQRNEKRDELHPYTQTLTITDLESCVTLEEATFPPHERCTREKFHYRLSQCGTLSFGIFTSADSNESTAATTDVSKPVYSGTPQRKAVLLGHIIATKTTNPAVTDDDMAIPSAADGGDEASNAKLGHKEIGRTVCIHSLATLPAYQGRGLGKTLLKAYLQRLEDQGVADRAALIAHDHLIPFYENFGFVNKGESSCKFGGGGWYDMVREFTPESSLQ